MKFVTLFAKKRSENVTSKSKIPLTVIVGANITAYRKLKNWSQAELAEQLGLTPVALSRIERGLSAPRFSTLEKLSQVFERPVVDFFYSQTNQAHFSHNVKCSETNTTVISEQVIQEIHFMAERIIQLTKR